jgi:hypothetical protein
LEPNVFEERQLQSCLLTTLLLDIERGFRIRRQVGSKEELEALILEQKSEDPEGPTAAYLTATLGCLNFQRSCQLHVQRLSAGGDGNSFATAVKLTCSEIIHNITKERKSPKQAGQKRCRESNFDGKHLGSWPEQPRLSSGVARSHKQDVQIAWGSAFPFRDEPDRKKRLKWADEQEMNSQARGVPGISVLAAEMDRCQLFGDEEAQDPE